MPAMSDDFTPIERPRTPEEYARLVEEYQAKIAELRASASSAKSEADVREMIGRISSMTRSFRLATGAGLPATPIGQAQELFPAFRSRPHLQLIDDTLVRAVKRVEKGRNAKVSISVAPRSGKALALDTRIPTPDGWTTMGDIQPGDWVFDEAGKPCRVTAVSEVWEDRECYEVTTSDGYSIVADADHEWLARLPYRSGYAIHNTRTLAEVRAKRPALPPHGALQMGETDLLLDPYLFGVWLGDGTNHGGSITTADDFIVQQFEAKGFIANRERSGKYEVGIGGLRPILRRLGVLAAQGGKRIPTKYLRASAAQRLALLQGLVDTDGYVAPDGGIEVTLANERLAREVRELVVSLGCKASFRHRKTAYKVDGEVAFNGDAWRVGFRHPQAARLPRKAQFLREPEGNRAVKALSRYVTVRKVENQATRCIEVDSPNHLFLAGEGMVPTHNSFLTSLYFPLWLLRRHPEWGIMMLSYDSTLSGGWAREMRRLIEDNPSLGIALERDGGAGAYWKTIEGGGVFATGVNGNVTGRGGRCVVGDSKVYCEYGELSAAEAYSRGIGWLLAYDHVTERPVWRRVVAAQRSLRSDIVEVATDAGRVLRCTSDHPVHASGGYTPAASLRAGEALVAVPVPDRVPSMSGAGRAGRSASSEVPDEGNGGGLLLAGVRDHGAGGHPAHEMVPLREGGEAARNLLLAGVPDEVWAEGPETPGHPLCGMWSHLPASKQQGEVLLSGLREQGSLPAHAGELLEAGGEYPSARRVGPAVPSAPPVHSGAGWRDVRGVQGSRPEALGRPSHRRGSEEQSGGEPDHGLPATPYDAPQVEADSVSVVRTVGNGEVDVYDFQVEGAHNFFADGLLVHNCIIVDDPVDGTASAHNRKAMDKLWRWWLSDMQTRAHPPFLIVVVGCLTGDTPVLMADGSEKAIRDVRIGDFVATFEDGALTTAPVTRWGNQGSDDVYSVTMASGRTVRANARHPFRVVTEGGGEEWVRAADLKPGDQVRSVEQRAARMDAIVQSEAGTSATATEWTPTTTSRPLQRRRVFVQSASGLLTPRTLVEEVASSLTTITARDDSGGSSATTEASSSGRGRQWNGSLLLPNTYAPTEDEVVSVVLDGHEDVFDIEVDRTHSFIANGVEVSNTRWSSIDFIERLHSDQYEGDPREWERIVIPTIADGGEDSLQRAIGEPVLSPLLDESPDAALMRWGAIKSDIGSYAWAGLYQQRPFPAEGAIFNIEDFRYWTTNPARATEDGKVVLLDPSMLENARWLDSWDATLDGGISSDWVVGQRWARDGADRYLIAQRRGRWSFTQTINQWREWARTNDDAVSPYGRLVHERLIENKANGPAIADVLQREISGIRRVPATLGKAVRARSITPEIESGNVFLPNPDDPGNGWVSEFLDEWRAFDGTEGHADDQVDAGVHALRALRDDSTGTGHISVPHRIRPATPQLTAEQRMRLSLTSRRSLLNNPGERYSITEAAKTDLQRWRGPRSS